MPQISDKSKNSKKLILKNNYELMNNFKIFLKNTLFENIKKKKKKNIKLLYPGIQPNN